MNCQLLLANLRIPYGNIIKFDATKMFNCSIHSIKFGLDNRVTRFSIFLKSHYLGDWRKKWRNRPSSLDYQMFQNGAQSWHHRTDLYRNSLHLVQKFSASCTETLCILYRKSLHLVQKFSRFTRWNVRNPPGLRVLFDKDRVQCSAYLVPALCALWIRSFESVVICSQTLFCESRNCGLQIVGSKLWAPNCGLQIVGSKLWAPNREL